MKIDDIKRYSDRILEAMTERDKSGRGYVCPACGSGTGKNGTGLMPVKGKPGYYHCFSAGCPFEHGDILELIGKTYHLADTAQQIEKAGQLAGIDFKNTWEPQGQNRRAEREGDKNHMENIDNMQNTDKNGINPEDFLKEKAEIQAFMDTAARAFLKSEKAQQYLQARGISLPTAERYKIGFVPNYGDGMNTPAIIIPTGECSYTARSMTTNESGRKIRKRKAGEKQGIFGSDPGRPLPPVVFLVEGEIDALSVIEAGFPAYATGGGTSKRELAETLRQQAPGKTVFYIIPDNDRLSNGRPDLSKGIKAGEDLRAMLKGAGIRAALVNVLGEKWPQGCKDSNDFLRTDRAGFVAFLDKIKKGYESKVLHRASGYMQDFINQIAGNTPPVPTGYPYFDRILEGGFHPGLIIIGAVPSMGKTTFCLNIADMLAGAGKDVIFYTLEMSRFELLAKIISRRTALYCLENGMGMAHAKTDLGVSDFSRWQKYSNSEKQLLQHCMQDFAEGAGQNLYIREGLQEIGTARIRQDIADHIFITGRDPIVIIDYVQIMASPDVHMSDKQKTDSNVIELKRISRDFNIPIIGISSVNRESYNQPAGMAVYKESGSLEFSASVATTLNYLGNEPLPGEKDTERIKRIREIIKTNEAAARQGKAVQIQCRILKNRNGAKGDVIFSYFPMFNLYLEDK